MFRTETEAGYPIYIPYRFRGYKIVKDINKGNFSAVVQVFDTEKKKEFAAKIISKSQMEYNNQTERIANEIEIHNSLNHPNIIKIEDSFEITNSFGEEFIILIEEYCPNGDFFDFIWNRKTKKESQIRKIAQQITSALLYLHQQGIAHCDIKPENILLDKDNKPKLCDFNLSVDTKKPFSIYDVGGTPLYQAPEMISMRNVDLFKADIWSLGIIIYALEEERLPFEFRYNRRVGPIELKTKNEKLKSLSKRCFEIDVSKRSDAENLIQHEFFNEIDENNLDDHDLLYTAQKYTLRRMKSGTSLP